MLSPLYKDVEECSQDGRFRSKVLTQDLKLGRQEGQTLKLKVGLAQVGYVQSFCNIFKETCDLIKD